MATEQINTEIFKCLIGFGVGIPKGHGDKVNLVEFTGRAAYMRHCLPTNCLSARVRTRARSEFSKTHEERTSQKCLQDSAERKQPEGKRKLQES